MSDEQIERTRKFLARDSGKPYQWGGSTGGADASTFVASVMTALAANDPETAREPCRVCDHSRRVHDDLSPDHEFVAR